MPTEPDSTPAATDGRTFPIIAFKPTLFECILKDGKEGIIEISVAPDLRDADRPISMRLLTGDTWEFTRAEAEELILALQMACHTYTANQFDRQ